MINELRDPRAAPRPRSPSRRQLFVLSALALTMAVFFVTGAAVVWHANHPVQLDRALARLGVAAGEEGPLGGHPRLAHWAEQLGTRTGVGLATAALVGLALLWRHFIVGLVALVAPLVCFAATEYLAKPLINEPVPFGGRAYPSGHMAGVTTVAVTALILVHRRWGGLALIVCVPLAVALVLLVGVAVLRLHPYPTDVLGGAALGSMVPLTLTAMLCRRLRRSLRTE